MINKQRIFTASCFALITTAMAFAIRAGILTQLGKDFSLSDTELGYITMMGFLGFPVATMIGGPLYNAMGPRKIMYVALIAHVLGILLTIFAGGFWTLFISTFFISFGNGTVEAACNPLIAGMFSDNKTTMLNRFHVWFPGGIVIGSLISNFMTGMSMPWQAQIAVMLIPTAIYAYLMYGQEFPEEDFAEQSTGSNLSAMLTPLYIFIACCMCLTATSELGTQQWIEKLLGSAGAKPMLVLAMVTGLMAVGRYFAGPVIHRFNPIGVLLGSSVLATIGIGLMSQAQGPMVYVAAVLFAAGVCYFWPTMIGLVAEYVPKSGAFGMSIMGGIGMFATSIFQPVIGGWMDAERAKATASGVAAEAAELVAGQNTLDNIAALPFLLILAFAGLYFTKGKLWDKPSIVGE